jgi:hypothetical protein
MPAPQCWGLWSTVKGGVLLEVKPKEHQLHLWQIAIIVLRIDLGWDPLD